MTKDLGLMRVRRLGQVLPGGEWAGPAWKAEGDIVLSNPPYGTIVHGVVCRDDGQPLYDLPLWADPPNGAVVVPVAPDGSLLFVELWRPSLPVPVEGAPYPPGDLAVQGTRSLELPRGFPLPGETPEQAGMREAQEETGLVACSAEAIGWINPNTTFCLYPIRVIAVRMSDEVGAATVELTEGPVRTVRLDRDEARAAVREGRIFCGFTLGALAHFWAMQS
jgi:8-oxo-dGTP pyrophosphatase MutT (NUDIX family)